MHPALPQAAHMAHTARAAGRTPRKREKKEQERRAQALAHHKTLDHYKAWADFKASDAAPVVSQVATKLNSVDFQ